MEVIGPLGTLELKDKDFQSFANSSLFIPKWKMNTIINDIKKSFIGVSRGWFLELNLKGLGFKTFRIKDKLAFDLGYSSLITFKPLEALKVKNFKGKLLLFSVNRDLLNMSAFLIKDLTKIDHYKGKGFSLKGDNLKLKKRNKI